MNILHIIAAPASGGAEAMVRDLSIAQRKLGHDAVIAFLDRAEDLGRDPDFEAKFLESLTQAGVRFRFLGHDTRRKPWLGWWRLRKLVTELRIDVVHTHLFYGVMFASRLKRPVVYTHHSEQPRFGRLAYRFLDSVVDHCVGISIACATSLRLFTKRPVTQISNGVDVGKFQNTVRQSSGQVKLVTLGRVTAQKDHTNLVDAVAMLPNAVRASLIVSIFGEGEAKEEASLNDQIVQSDLSNTVFMRGVTSDIPGVLSQNNIFVLSSQWEGLPIALLEAIASGLPCIVTDVGGCGETVREFENGIVVPPQNAAQLSEAIMTAVNEPDLVASWSRNSLQAREKIDIIHKAQQHLAVYQKAWAVL